MNCLLCSQCQEFKTDKCNKYCPKYFTMDWLVQRSNLPLSKRKESLLVPDSCDVEQFRQLQYVQDNIEKFVKGSNNLYICGNNPQNGKTSWAINLLLAYYKTVPQGRMDIHKGVFVSVPTFLQKWKDNMNNYDINFEYFRGRLQTCDIVIWDDITTNSLSNYDSNVLYTYLNERHLQEKCNIYTGRTDVHAINNLMDASLSSAIKKPGTHVIRLNGEAYKENDFFTDYK